MTAWLSIGGTQYEYTGRGFTGWVRFESGWHPNGSWSKWNEITDEVR